MFVYFSEIFPTSVKAIGILISYASGSAGNSYLFSFFIENSKGSLSASYGVDYAESFNIPPMVFLGAVVAMETVICYWLKETFDIEREEQIEELKIKHNSLIFCIKDVSV